MPLHLRPRALVAPSLSEALKVAIHRAKATSGSVVVAGSLYLVGEARAKLTDPVGSGLY